MAQHWRTLQQVWNDHKYERRRPVLPNDVVVDAGAHIGTFTVKAAARALRVYAFEPEHENYEFLELNTGRCGNVKIQRKALWSANGKAWLNVSRDDLNHSLLVAEGESYVGRELVETVRLDDAVDDRVDFLKVNAEGAELEIFKGAHRTLASYKPYIAAEIGNEEMFQDAVALLRRYGYNPRTASPNRQYGVTFFE